MIEIYTDGSSNNTTDKAAGWAYVIAPLGNNKIWRAVYGHLSPPSTNNIGEMLGVLMAMKKLLEFGQNLPPVKIISDSQYVVKGINEWRSKWERTALPEKNYEIWVDLFATYDRLKLKTPSLSVCWVKGHAGNKGNELADVWAGHGKNNSNLEVNGPLLNTKKFYGDLVDCLEI